VKSLVQDDVRHGLRIAPLVDIVFLLLVFFLVATTFYEGERDLAVSLADSSVGDERSADDVTVINIRQNGEVRIGVRPVSGLELRQELQELSGGSSAVIIRCDRHAHHDAFVGVLEACREAGITRVAVATSSEE
jgi:biopolymer transport protein ExbD